MMTSVGMAHGHQQVEPRDSAPDLEMLLGESAQFHAHGVCPRQILGVRMGIHAGQVLDLAVPRRDKRLLAIVETTGCFVDGLSAATGCRIGSRTLRLEDHGKVAATIVDTATGVALRFVPASGIRDLALDYAPSSPTRRDAQLIAYRRMPAAVLFAVRQVSLLTPLAALLSTPNALTRCDRCGEEIINGREVRSAEVTLCRACHGMSYYR